MKIFKDGDFLVYVDKNDKKLFLVEWTIGDYDQYLGFNGIDTPLSAKLFRAATQDEVELGHRIDGNNP